MRRLKRATALSCLGKGIASLALLGSTVAADPLTTNNPGFRIPFAIDAANANSAGTAILFSSKDGSRMEVLRRADARAGGFEFNAPSDGHYAFAVRMTDANGEVVGGPGTIEPELEVIVDTTPPTLHFQLAEATPGEVAISWTCNESSVVPSSLRLEYAEGSDGRWVPIESLEANGRTTIRSQSGNSVSVRGSVTDRAGNRGTGSGQIVLTATTSNPANFPGTAGRSDASNALSIPGGQANQPLGASPFYPGNGPAGAKVATANDSAEPAAQYPGNNTISAYPAPPQQQQHFSYGAPQQPAAAVRPYRASSYNPTSSTYVPELRSSQSTPGGQIVKNRVFDINYEVQDVGPSGVSSVKLFVTENNGQNWFSYGEDIDLRSPFQVDTRGEGTFGFAVRVRNGLGFSDAPPQPGEMPSIVVTVDQTPPIANLAQPQIIADGSGRIRLRWNTTDPHPSSAPVRLEYAISTSGPWTPVFDWQPDQGGHEMPIQPGMPANIYYRLLVRDAAGNVATTQTPHPLMIDQHRPTVKLLSIQPVNAAPGY